MSVPTANIPAPVGEAWGKQPRPFRVGCAIVQGARYLALMLALEELTASTCQWPVAEFERGVFLCCGEAVDPSLTTTMRCYYRRHARLAYLRPRHR